MPLLQDVDLVACARAVDDVVGVFEHAPRGEEGQRAPAGEKDRAFDRPGHRVAELGGVGLGHVARHDEEALPLPVEWALRDELVVSVRHPELFGDVVEARPVRRDRRTRRDDRRPVAVHLFAVGTAPRGHLVEEPLVQDLPDVDVL